MERSTRGESESITKDGSQGDLNYNELLSRGRALEVKVLVGFVDDSRLRRVCTKKPD